MGSCCVAHEGLKFLGLSDPPSQSSGLQVHALSVSKGFALVLVKPLARSSLGCLAFTLSLLLEVGAQWYYNLDLECAPKAHMLKAWSLASGTIEKWWNLRDAV